MRFRSTEGVWVLCACRQVEYPDGRQTLVMMPAKFNKKLWVRRGGFLIVDNSAAAEADASTQVTGTIRTVLYSEHIKELLKLPGVWCVRAGRRGDSGGSGQGRYRQPRQQAAACAACRQLPH